MSRDSHVGGSTGMLYPSECALSIVAFLSCDGYGRNEYRNDTAASPVFERERLYRTKVEVVSIRGAQKSPRRDSKGTNGAKSVSSSQAFFVQGAISGVVRESGRR